MYVAKIEEKTNIYLDTPAKLIPEKFPLKPKALASLENFNEAEE